MIILNCAQCDLSFKAKDSRLNNSKSGLFFCSRKCKDLSQRIGGMVEIMPPHYTPSNGKSYDDYRNRAVEAFGPVCIQCDYQENIKMLDVHHIDGDRSNSELSNLEVLCVWCHAFETRKVTPHLWTGKFEI